MPDERYVIDVLVQIFLLRSIKAYLCANIINFDAVDFSGRRPEEVISFFWRSVYKHCHSLMDLTNGIYHWNLHISLALNTGYLHVHVHEVPVTDKDYYEMTRMAYNGTLLALNKLVKFKWHPLDLYSYLHVLIQVQKEEKKQN